MRRVVDKKYATRLLNHGPVVLVSAFSADRRLGVTPVAWCMPMKKSPPRIVLEIGASHYIRRCIAESGDFAVNIVGPEHVKDLVYCGSVSGRDVDKLSATCFTSEDSVSISSARISEAIAVLECRFIEPELADKHNLLVGEVLHAEAEEKNFTDRWSFDGDGPKTLHHLGGKVFCTPSGEIKCD